MKTSFPVKFAAFAVAALSTITALSPLLAATFGKTEVDQNKFVAVAQPLANNTYKLLVIEQLSSARPCWSESGSSPVQVQPLLLNFDFTGICSRSLDSNGYSIRMADQDLGLQYSLRVVKRDGDVRLVGSSTSRNAPVIEIGRTNGVSNDFSKIVLNPGWRMTKRSYDGKTLGHIYFTSDQALGATPTDGGNTGGTKFADIRTDVYGKEIDQAVELGFVAGFSDNTFRPQETLTREQLVSLVVESLKNIPNANITLPTQATSSPYPDVETSRWSAAKIQWARDNNLISGYQDGTFRPAQSVTRAEMMAVLRRAAEKGKSLRGLPTTLGAKQTPKVFSDTSTHWAAPLITQMSGYCNVASPLNETGNAFYPDQAARRNYAAAATLRTLNCVKSESATPTP